MQQKTKPQISCAVVTAQLICGFVFAYAKILFLRTRLILTKDTVISIASLNDLYSCPMKTQHPSDALSHDLSKVVNKLVMYIYYLRQKQRYCTKISILATAQTYDVTSASKLR